MLPPLQPPPAHPERPLGRPPGRPAVLPGLRAADAFRGGELFREEAERALERQGGAQAVAERAELARAARRADRRAGFERPDTPPRREPSAGEPGAPDRVPAAPSAAGPAPRAAAPFAEGAAPATSPGATSAPPPEGAASATAAGPGGALPSEAPPLPSGAGASAAAAATLPAGPAAAAQPGPAVAGAPGVEGPAAAGRARAAHSPAPAPAASPEEAERAQEILRQIRLHLAPGRRALTVELEPRELGRLSIEIALRNGRLFALVRAESPETLALLGARLPELLAALAEQGLEPESFELAQGFAEPRGHRQSSLARRHAPAIAEQSAATTPERTVALHASPTPGIDTYA